MKRESMITGLLLAICGITQLHEVTPTTTTMMASATPAGENGNAMFNLDAYQWKNRLLLVFADNVDDAYKQQMQLLTTQTGLAERDLLLVQVLTQGTSRLNNQVLAPEVAKQLRSQFNVPAGFTVILVGKDGTVKRRQRTPVSPTVIFNQIDAMPMRQQEMKRLPNG